MNWLCRIVSVLLVLGLALGTPAQAARMGTTATAAAMMHHGEMPVCPDCGPDQGATKGLETAGCHGGVCIVLPGLLPATPASPSIAPDTILADAVPVPDGLSPRPDHRPPISASLA